MTTIASTLATALPSPKPVQPPGTDGINTIFNWLYYGGLSMAIAGLIIFGATLWINSRRGEGQEQMGKLGYILLGVVVMSAATSLIGALAR